MKDMKNKFEHEINITRHFLDTLESHLSNDQDKMLEEMTERYYTLEQESTEQLRILVTELTEARLKISRMGMERGVLLNKIKELERKNEV